MSTIVKNERVRFFENRFSRNGDDSHFTLDDCFFSHYNGLRPNFGFGGLGEFVFYRTYSRIKEDGSKETFADTIKRVVEGCYEIQRRYCKMMHIPWTRSKAQASAQEMFRRIWEFKFIPPGRGLWAMGTKFMWERGSAALNNCAFYSTQDIARDPAEPFGFMVDMLMLGVGVGFDIRGAGKLQIVKPDNKATKWTVPDSREGWADSVRALIESFTIHPEYGMLDFDYSGIRKAGEAIKGFGGKASGPGILESLHNSMTELLSSVLGRTDNYLTSVDIVDLMNFIGRCVVAGNVRRSSEIAFGDPDDALYTSMKDPQKHSKELMSHRWASNNSIFSTVGMDYTDIAKQVAMNGEPGFMWLDNARNYGRMIDGYNPNADPLVMGANPCVEQSLESAELCCLVETFPANHDDLEDYMRTLKFAYLYAKTVTLLPTHHQQTNSVLLRNRRIGLSQSGIVQAFKKFGRRQVLSEFCNKGYAEICRWDDIYSGWLCCGKSRKKTSVKPSGSVALVVGATAGIHYTIAPTRSYWRNVKLSVDSKLVQVLKKAGYHIEPDLKDDRTCVVKFGVEVPDIETVGEISIWEQVKNAVDYQRYWADNQVSCTIQFSKEEAGDIAKVLECFDDQLKGISFLPMMDHGYKQAPYMPATTDEVRQYNKGLLPMDMTPYINEDSVGSRFCDGDTCTI